MGQEYSDTAEVAAPRAVQAEIPAEDATDAHVSFKEKLLEGLAEALGYTELAGIRYPVKAYQFRVSQGLTRGSRLTLDDVKDLAKRGYKGVVNLCKEYDDTKIVEEAGMKALHLKVLDNVAPPEDAVLQFLDFVTRVENQPAYVHCEAGKGRTGVFVASYRMAVMEYTADQAIKDGEKFGLQLTDQENFIRDFYRHLDAGNFKGYPLPPGSPGSQPVSGDVAGHADNPSAKNAPDNWHRADSDEADEFHPDPPAPADDISSDAASDSSAATDEQEQPEAEAGAGDGSESDPSDSSSDGGDDQGSPAV
jgi:protein tyrosine phosphatase (PTP) superfamily phosphohydrolase (DUF442 family)